MTGINAEPGRVGPVAGIELGGTKTVVVLGCPGAIERRIEYPTTTPEETLGRAIETIRPWCEAGQVFSLGVASFGPIRVTREARDFGFMLETPKPGWAGTDIAGVLQRALGCPVGLDTDVNAAALAEYRFGAARDCPTAAYITVGTGVGVGVLVNGAPVHGLLHPEVGHVRLRRAAGDGFAGACPFHGDCIEGLLSGPALAARFGRHPGAVGPDDPAWAAAASDLAELLTMLVLTLSAQRIVVGGGVANRQPHLLPAARALMPALLGGYLRDCTAEALERICVPPALGDDAGPMGALIVGAAA
ncbi:MULTISPECIES: ROK family protein [Sphingomonadaceae]|uniref:ROK family protein n=1 Tax=Sphingomonadaceae TaxID=41297 RepID=UPI001AF4E271|nr:MULTISPECIES: ROK family protein [Sphingomonadaceae]QSR15896.1 fructokinase [Novosphingobium sp. KA1]